MAQAEDDEDSIVLLGDFSRCVDEFLAGMMRAIDILPTRASKIAAYVSREHAHQVIRQVHAKMCARSKTRPIARRCELLASDE